MLSVTEMLSLFLSRQILAPLAGTLLSQAGPARKPERPLFLTERAHSSFGAALRIKSPSFRSSEGEFIRSSFSRAKRRSLPTTSAP